jgi:hypothetical protein
MSVTPDTIAVALGQTAPEPDSVQWKQWELWITDAEMLIETRRLAAEPVPVIDEAKLDYVVREAVVAQVKKPDDATQVTVSIDDASSSRTYQSGKGRVTILDEWWTLLGLTESNGGAYSWTRLVLARATCLGALWLLALCTARAVRISLAGRSLRRASDVAAE